MYFLCHTSYNEMIIKINDPYIETSHFTHKYDRRRKGEGIDREWYFCKSMGHTFFVGLNDSSRSAKNLSLFLLSLSAII